MTTDKDTIGYAYNFAADLGNGRQFSISGNFSKAVSVEQMNAESDKILALINRQQAKAAIAAASQEIEQRIFQKTMAENDFKALEAKQGNLSASERENRKMAAAHIEKLGADIEYKKGVLAKLEFEAK